jgi:mannose-6-phosphate isomerase-like protein (cupin superfamily)
MSVADGAREPRNYDVQKVTTVIAGTDVQVREFVVAPKEEIPWHFHTAITDWCYCLEGQVRAEIYEAADAGEITTVVLSPGESCRIDPGRRHRLTNGGMTLCRYLLVQGGGQYDFNKVAAPLSTTA